MLACYICNGDLKYSHEAPKHSQESPTHNRNLDGIHTIVVLWPLTDGVNSCSLKKLDNLTESEWQTWELLGSTQSSQTLAVTYEKAIRCCGSYQALGP